MAALDAIDFYWRPGCGFCARLERRLDTLSIPLAKRNIWDDPADAAVVRSIAGGNETVPTVVVGTAEMVNPSPDQVLAAIAEQAPHLLPEGWTPPEPGPVTRLVGKLRRD